jgi:hypothetical protein
LGGFKSPGDYANFKFPPPSRYDPDRYRITLPADFDMVAAAWLIKALALRK